MAVKLGSLKVDLKRESEGEWVPIPDLPGVKLKVRSFNYGPYKMANSVMLQRLARKYGRDPVPDDVKSKEVGKLYADHLLLGWEGFDVDYSPETALATLTDPAFRELLNHVDYAAFRVGAAEVEFIEGAAGN